jgi:hypothetical protein
MAEHSNASNHHGYYRQGPPADGPSPLGWRGYGNCAFCYSEDTVWQHDLNRSLTAFRTLNGSGSVRGTSHKLCERCERLYSQGDYGALARLEQTTPWSHDDDLAALLVAIAAFCRADRGSLPLAVPQFPLGFEPWEEFTGASWLFDLWPEEHRMVLAETRRPQIDDDPDAQIELLASPWPSLNLKEALIVLWRWAERDWDPEVTPDPYLTRVPEALTWTEDQATGLLEE